MIRISHRNIVLILSAVLACGAALAGSAASLDGKTFLINLTHEDGKSQEPDTLIFAEGQLDSTQCRKYGFTKSDYTSKKEKDALTFEATGKSPTEGVNHWTGTVRGDKIEGTLKWTDKAGKVTHYKFEGKLAS